MEVKTMELSDREEWLKLSRQYDKFIIEMGADLRQWYNGNGKEDAFGDYMERKISNKQALMAVKEGACLGIAAFSFSNNSFSFFAVEGNAPFEQTARLLISSVLSRLDTSREVTVNIMKSRALLIERQREVFRAFGFEKIEGEFIENGVKMEKWRVKNTAFSLPCLINL